jgi:signal transduction histidine kinase
MDNERMTGTTPVPRLRPRRALSVRVRILATMLLVTAAGMSLAGGTAYFVQRERTLVDIDDSLATDAADSRVIAEESAGSSLEAALGALIQRLRPGADQSTVGIIDGTAALTPGGDVDFRLEQQPGFVDRVVDETANGTVVRGTAASGALALRYIAVPVTVAGDPRAGVFVKAVDLPARLALIDQAFRTFTVVALAALLCVALVGWFVAGRLLRPIRALREAAARITASDVGERIPVVGRDDVSDLTYTVNQMLDRLDGALTSQRRLLDDVGHELKTPVTIVRGHLEVMNAADPRDVIATRELAIDELDRMSGLVRDISTLADVDRPMLLARQPTDIAAFTERLRAKAEGLSGHAWRVVSSAGIVASVDPERMTQAVLQLAANAATHGAPGGVIEIGSALDADSLSPRTGSRVDGRLRLWVENDGRPISDETQLHIFERFRRGSSVGRGAAGSGLGLAIVAVIAEAHGGTVGVVSRAGLKTRFTIDIPIEVHAPISVGRGKGAE